MTRPETDSGDRNDSMSRVISISSCLFQAASQLTGQIVSFGSDHPSLEVLSFAPICGMSAIGQMRPHVFGGFLGFV